MKSTQVRVTYDKVKNIKLVRPTVKRYLAGFTKSQFRRIDADEFVSNTVTSAKFKKASADTVWAESSENDLMPVNTNPTLNQLFDGSDLGPIAVQENKG